jgi:hypothetical protein
MKRWTSRLAGAITALGLASAGNSAAVGNDTPPEYSATAKAIVRGEAFTFTDASFLFTGGMASELLEACALDLSAADRAEIAAFVYAVSQQAMMGNDYGNPDLSEALSDQLSSGAAFAAGIETARQAGCSEPLATTIAGNILGLVRANRSGPDGGEPPFLGSCGTVFSGPQCACLAQLGSAVYTDIYQMTYSRDVIAGIIQANPLLGLQVAMVCGISEY